MTAVPNGYDDHDLRNEMQALSSRLSVLDQQRRGIEDRIDRIDGGISELGERLRGTHGVACDAVAGISAVRVTIDYVRKQLDAISLAVEALVKHVPAARPKRNRK